VPWDDPAHGVALAGCLAVYARRQVRD